MRRHGRAQLRRRSPSPWEESPRRLRSSRSPPRRAAPPPRRRRRRRRVRDFDSRDGSFDSFGSQADFDSRSRTPRRFSRSGGNAVPLGRYEPPNDPEARIWILHSDAAKVIGRNGRALREVENRTSTRIQVSKEEDMLPETKERSVDISGSRRDQDAAVELILEKVLYCREDGGEVIKDLRTAQEESKGDQRIITVLPEEVGKVLGRKGETVRIIERDSGAKVELNKTEGKVEIFGKKEEQDKAVELLLAEVHYAKDAEGNVLKDEPRPKQRTENEPELPPPLKFWVKDREAGKVIGRGGETVREVMEKSGSDIKVQKADEMAPGTKERLIKVIGTKEQQDEALQLILEEVTWAKGVDGMLKGAAPESAEKPEETEAKEGKEGKEGKESKEGEEAKPKPPDKAKSVPTEAMKPRRFRETARELNRPKSGPARWVCATCGGDHRMKECPHATGGNFGVGVQMGMQMGLQAMGLGGPGMPPMPMPPIPGMPGMPPMPMPPGMPGMPPLPGLPMLPGMKMPGMPSSGSSTGSSSSEEDEPMDSRPPEPHRRRVRKVLRRRRDTPEGGNGGVQKKKIVMSDL